LKRASLPPPRPRHVGYEDDYVRSTADHKLFVNGFDSLEAVHSYLEDLMGCTLVE